MNIASLDLNLLLAFDAVMRERHVTKAAQSLFMTQPALSNALNRLRHVFKDELFVRSPKGMRPTPKALELAEPIRRAMAAIDEAINPAVFDPANSEHQFRIICHDQFIHTGLPKLMQHLHQHAPGVNVRLFPAKGDSYAALDSQQIDFGISAYGQPPDRFDFTRLTTDDYVVLMGAGHPLAGVESMTLAQFAAQQHVLVSLSGDDHGFIDKALEVRGMSRRTVLTVNQFSVVPEIVQDTHMIATIPRQLAEGFLKHYDLSVALCPLQPPRAYCEILLIWHRRLSNHPANEWFRQTLASLYKH